MRLGDIAKVISGYAFKSSSFLPKGIPVVKIKNVRTGYVDLSDVQYVDESFLSIDKKYHIYPDDILISLTGSHITQPGSVVGRVAIQSRSHPLCFLNQRAGKISINNKEKYDNKYLFYKLSSNKIRNAIATMAHGAASQANISPKQVESIKFDIPVLRTQKKIASILSAYDTLIENNTRRIQILEEMAQRIYKEWFVDFKYPGHENDKFVDSELGMIPKGWKIKKTDEVFGVLGGGTPSTKIPEYWENGIINWYSPKDLTKSNSMFMLKSGNQISELGLQKSSAKLFPAFSVMLTSRATIGVVSINTTEACTNQGFISCVPSEHMSTYQIYYWLLSNIKMFLAHSSGATFKELTKTTFKQFDLVVPPKNISRSFNDLVIPFADQIYNLQKQQETLRQTRDLLLPKLISGKVDVSNMDIDTSILDD